MTELQLWGSFSVAALFIIFAGWKLTTYGDILSERLNLGHAFIGAVLIGWSTSLPELVLSIGTASFADAPDITLGNVLGSNLFNIIILVFMSCVVGKPVLRTIGKKVSISAFLSLAMIAVVGVFLTKSVQLGGLELGPITLGYDAIVVFAVYMVCMATLYFTERGGQDQKTNKYDDVDMKILAAKCIAVVGIIVAMGLWLSTLAKEINTVYPSLEQGFVGSFFLAIVSSLPEVITCFIAVRMGFNSMAVGTLFGSNIFNMGIIAVCDIFYKSDKGDGQIFAGFQSPSDHYMSVITVMVMTVLCISVILTKTNKIDESKKWYIGFESFALIALYLVALYCVFDPTVLGNRLWH